MTFRALLLTRAGDDGAVTASVTELDDDAFPSQSADPKGTDDVHDAAPSVEIEVSHSSLNYKDALIVTGRTALVRSYPHVPGIDLAGTVIASDRGDVRIGSEVLVTGCWLGERHWGGMASRARVPASWLVARPDGLDAARAMALGTAGFTAQLSVDALQAGEVTPDAGPVLVTGATGGVGSIAVHLLASAGYEVHAASGRADAHELLSGLGAASIVPRASLEADAARPLASARWAGVVDVAGGATLAGALAATAPRGVVVACGLAGGAELHTSVMPMIVRGVTLTGIDSVLFPMPRRAAVWARLHADVDREVLESITSTITIEDVPARAVELLDRGVRGRTLVEVR
jgi:acrylyl-CoA reductase (NADPH)